MPAVGHIDTRIYIYEAILCAGYFTKIKLPETGINCISSTCEL